MPKENQMTPAEIERLEILTGVRIKRHQNGWLWMYQKYQAEDPQATEVDAIADFINLKSAAIAIVTGQGL